MKGVNKAILIGNLGRDPEVQNLDGGKIIAKFPLATTERYKDAEGNRQEHTEWHNIVAWGQLADICGKYMRKGSMVYVEGRLKTSNWTDKDNNKRYRTDIVADVISMLDRKSDNPNGQANGQPYELGTAAQPAGNGYANHAGGNEGMEDLPF